MEAKKAFGFASFLMMLVVGMAFVSSETSNVFTITDISAPSSVSENAGSFTFTFNLTYTGGSPDMDFSFDNSNSTIGTVSIPDALDFDGSSGPDFKIVTGTVTGFSNQGGNSMNVIIDALSTSSERDNEQGFSVLIDEVFQFCEEGENGTLEIKNFYIDNLGNGEDEEWEPLDEIEIEVEVENKGDDKVKDVTVEIMILDSSGDDVTNDFDFEDETIDLKNLDEDEEDTALFIINEVPADLDEGNYRIYLKAYDDGDEELQCTSTSSDFNGDDDQYHEVEFNRDEDQAVIIKDDDLNDQKILASCGDENVAIDLPVYNIGEDKEDKVLVYLYNNELGIAESFLIDNLRSGKRRDANFFINLPEEMSRTNYVLNVINYYDYDDDEDEFDLSSYDRNSEEDLDEDYRLRLEVLSCGSVEPTMTAELQSEAMLDEEMVVKVLIRNNGNADTFSVSLSSIESWADVISIEPSTLSIGKDGTGEVTLRFIPKAEGSQTFRINSIVGGESFEQSVSVNIEGEQSFIESIGDTAAYALIGIIALVILILLTLIVKVSRRKNPVEF